MLPPPPSLLASAGVDNKLKLVTTMVNNIKNVFMCSSILFWRCVVAISITLATPQYGYGD
jgi:hypothetical protein